MNKSKANQTSFAPGQSGNPKGKPRGSGALQKLRAEIAKDIPEILKGLSAMAKKGDVQSARLLLERVLPPVKAIEQPVAINLPSGGTLSETASALMRAASDGTLAPGQAAQLISALGAVAKVIEIDELAKRITKLESQHGNKS